MRKQKKGNLIRLLFLAAVIVVIVFILGEKEEGIYETYPEFYAALENGEIAQAVIEKDGVRYQRDRGEPWYYTDNPEYEGFKERLLLAGVQVTDKQAENDPLMYVLDILFYVFFLGAVWIISAKAMKGYQNAFKVVKHTGVTFQDIAGMEELKREMIHMADILKNPQRYESKGIRPAKGIVLEGPPGNGKTLFAKALAQEAGVNFIATKGADFQSALMSLGPAKIKQMFKRARKYRPCIVFIDEFDGIGEKRNYAGSGIDKENNRIITAMLNEMDGFEGGNGVLVIAATNSYAALDEALIRPGRFDLKYTVGNPDEKTREALVNLYTAKKNLSSEVTRQYLIKRFEGMSCAAIEAVLNEAATICLREQKTAITGAEIEAACRKMNA